MTLNYNDPTVVLCGQVYTDFFFGRPNYGESPDSDEIQHAIILALDEPICVEGDGLRYEGDFDGITESFVDRVQIVAKSIKAFQQLRGYGVRVTGSLFHAHSGHHHTKVLISVDGDPVVEDDRNAFPGKKLVGSGSGFLLGNGGLIGTAAHVVEDASNISVARGLFRQHASLVGIDKDLDLAILKIEPRGAMAAVIQSRERKVRPTRNWLPPRLGERIYAFGFPLGGKLPHSLNMTEGLISSEMGIQNHHFQMSAAIQPGSSGGPVFDELGNFLGVVVESLRTYQTVNFCVRSKDFSRFCYGNGIRLVDGELRDTKLSPAILAEAALHFCVEVESWSDVGGVGLSDMPAW